jgi:hypothetical protein
MSTGDTKGEKMSEDTTAGTGGFINVANDGPLITSTNYWTSPFAIHTLANQWDRPLPQSDSGRTDILFHVYRGGRLAWKTTAKFRMVSRLPYLRPWK